MLLAGIHHISEKIFLIASETVADNVSEEDLARGSLYPPLSAIKECSMQIASKILEYAYDERKSNNFTFTLTSTFKMQANILENKQNSD